MKTTKVPKVIKTDLILKAPKMYKTLKLIVDFYSDPRFQGGFTREGLINLCKSAIDEK